MLKWAGLSGSIDMTSLRADTAYFGHFSKLITFYSAEIRFLAFIAYSVIWAWNTYWSVFKLQTDTTSSKTRIKILEVIWNGWWANRRIITKETVRATLVTNKMTPKKIETNAMNLHFYAETVFMIYFPLLFAHRKNKLNLKNNNL